MGESSQARSNGKAPILVDQWGDHKVRIISDTDSPPNPGESPLSHW